MVKLRKLRKDFSSMIFGMFSVIVMIIWFIILGKMCWKMMCWFVVLMVIVVFIYLMCVSVSVLLCILCDICV